jgi:hypothetical protein
VGVALGISVPPALQQIQAQSALQACGSNQRQLARALFNYRDDFQSGWPWVDLKGIDPFETSKYNFHFTVRGFERLHQTYPEAAQNEIFFCPGINKGPGPSTPKTGRALTTRLSGGDEWGWQRNDDSIRIPYAWDWSAPANSRLKRVILADRSPGNHNHEQVVATYADGSLSTLPVAAANKPTGSSTGRTITITQGYDGQPLTGSERERTVVTEDENGKAIAEKVTEPGDFAVVYNPKIPALILEDDQEQAPDNIYDLNQDILNSEEEQSQLVNGGSISRTWLR